MNTLWVHGRAQGGKSSEIIQTEWMDAFRNGLGAARKSMPFPMSVVVPFYGNALDDLVKQLDSPTIDVAIARGAVVDVEMEFRAKMLLELAQGVNVPHDEAHSDLDEPVRERGVLNWRVVHSAMRVLDRTPLGARAIDLFTRDVYAYLHYPAIRRAINAIVADLLTPGEWVVVGHSLGSVVAYNVLCAVKPGVTVRRFVTVGSPLGVQAIIDKLGAVPQMPRCAREWFNAYDPNDVVALNPLDARRFPVSPPITNYGKIVNTTENQHGIAGYLDNEVVAGKII